MKTKLVKSITSYLLFACVLVCLVAVIAMGTSGTAAAAAADGQGCSEHTLRGLYLSGGTGTKIGGNLVPKTVMEGKRFTEMVHLAMTSER